MNKDSWVFKNGKIMKTETSKYESAISILFAGDLCPIRRTEKMILDGKSSEIIAPLLPSFFNRDIAVTNLEGPLTKLREPIQKTGPNIKIDPSCIQFIKEAKFDVVTLANNHIGDFGTNAVLETMELLDCNGISHVGGGKDLKDAQKPLYFEKKGVKIALLSYAEHEFGAAGENSAGFSPMDPVSVIRDIKNASAKADITAVIIHGGNEHCPVPNPATVNHYRAFAESGASAVVGIHTHCPQGMEIHDGVPIIYSLGNFLFDYRQDSDKPDRDNLWWKGYMTKIRFMESGALLSVEIIPYTFWPDGTSIQPMGGEEIEVFLDYLTQLSALVADDTERNNLWDAWCLMHGPWWIENRFKNVEYPAASDDKWAFEIALSLRNGLTCSAHYELIKNFFQMICEGRIENAKSYVKKIEALQRGGRQ